MLENELPTEGEDCQLTLSASHTRTVLSNDDVASLFEVAAKRTSVTISECSSNRIRTFCVSTSHRMACKEAHKASTTLWVPSMIHHCRAPRHFLQLTKHLRTFELASTFWERLLSFCLQISLLSKSCKVACMES